MTEKKEGMPDMFPNLSAPTTVREEKADEDNNYKTFKVKNFTSETNDKNVATAVLNILIDENKSTQKSIALLNRNIHELLVLLKDKNTQDRERRF